MKKVINGKVYDTGTARKVGCIDFGLEDRLFGWSETLFVKRTGEYFLLGEGGPGSKYSVRTGVNESSGSTKIFPLAYDEACKWAEDNLDGDEYIAEFGEIAEGGTNAKLTLYLPASTIERAKRKVAQGGTTLSAYVEALINASLSE
nr:MAG TPA: Putative plasmid related protein-helix-helix, DNA BINDING PROTEIN [Caudoviricetes sp.]